VGQIGGADARPFRPDTKVERVEAGRVILKDGAGEIPFDLLLAVPPHRVVP